MAKIISPVLFSDFFKIDTKQLEAIGVFDPTLNVDTKLFIDPLLIEDSSHSEIKVNATLRIKEYFGNIITLLKASSSIGDLPWREADRRMHFPEIAATCLGYGAATIRGSAFGPLLRAKLLSTAKEIINLGIVDPQLFMLLPLLEEDIGPDRISDMVTRIILPELAAFTSRITNQLSLPAIAYTSDGTIYNLPKNPFEKKTTPVILVPRDILSKLPVAIDWSDVADAAYRNSVIRTKVNKYIGAIWKAKVRKEKEELRKKVLSSCEAFQTLLDLFQGTKIKPYDFDNDPDGLLRWRQLLRTIAEEFPLKITHDKPVNINSVASIVEQINHQFAFLVEKKGLSKLLWKDKKTPHHEHVSQKIYFAVADSYCKANNLDITPEADTGSGAVDFKFAKGYDSRVLVEIKLSTNKNTVPGYINQLETYAKAEQTMRAIYLVIDVGKMGKKDEALIKIKNQSIANGQPTPDLIFVDGTLKPSASKRK